MEKPPICSYEGSDYQTTFWDQGGREYEDAVEGVALRRLLPPGGKHMLELGAGAGRNTPRYQGYEQITLLDYSLTQLQQARQRLGDNPRFRYVAADVYRLPFAPGLFDGATMIRTLHHMADARRALDQVRRGCSRRASFILEFANSTISRRSSLCAAPAGLSPFSPEPVEFVALNFDFHPNTVRAWLQQVGFSIERQLTVSHFRMGLLKRIVPLRLLVWADSLAQLTGDLWQLSPSVFVRARASGAGQPAAEGEFFRCPACGAPLPDTPPELVCGGCGVRYPVVDGIYDLRVKE